MTRTPIVLALAALLAVGCGAADATVDATGETPMITITGELTYLPRIMLTPGGTATITVNDVSPQDVAAPVVGETIVELKDRQVPIPFDLAVDPLALDPAGGNASCNSYSTTYRIDGASLQVDGQIAVTMMACDPASNRQEQTFLTVMNEIVDGEATVQIDGASLTIMTAGGATITATR